MGKYSIKELESLTGIKAHTIRVWEKRYGIIEPERTATNIRYYSDRDVKRIMNVAILNHHGIKISKISSLSDDELTQKVMQLTMHCREEDRLIDLLVAAMIELDEFKFEKILNSTIFKIGFEETVQTVVYPFLERIGVLWQTGSINVAQEHFMSHLIKHKLIVAIDSLPPVEPKPYNQFMLFLPEEEQHEIGLLFYYYLLKKAGYFVIYLGQALPFADLKEICDIRKPNYLLTSFVCTQSNVEVSSYIIKLNSIPQPKKIYITGVQIEKTGKLPPRIEKIPSLSAIKEKIFV